MCVYVCERESNQEQRAAVLGGAGGGGERSLRQAHPPQLFPLWGDLSYGCWRIPVALLRNKQRRGRQKSHCRFHRRQQLHRHRRHHQYYATSTTTVTRATPQVLTPTVPVRLGGQRRCSQSVRGELLPLSFPLSAPRSACPSPWAPPQLSQLHYHV